MTDQSPALWRMLDANLPVLARGWRSFAAMHIQCRMPDRLIIQALGWPVSRRPSFVHCRTAEVRAAAAKQDDARKSAAEQPTKGADSGRTTSAADAPALQVF